MYVCIYVYIHIKKVLYAQEKNLYLNDYAYVCMYVSMYAHRSIYIYICIYAYKEGPLCTGEESLP
jgi:hypothetical protein